MDIVYKKLSENELSRIIQMRIDQLTEEYTSVGRTVPQDVNLEASLMDFYKRIRMRNNLYHSIGYGCKVIRIIWI